MNSEQIGTPWCRRASLACGGAVAATGCLALCGWAAGRPGLLVGPGWMPMAPNTALAFLILGVGLVAAVGGRAGGWLAGPAAAFVVLVGVARVLEDLTGAALAVDDWFMSVRGGRVGPAPTGKMSLPTAATMTAAALALLGLSRARPRGALRHLVGAGGGAAAVSGLVFALGYLFSPQSPLAYGAESIPMALDTAACFVALGAGLVAAAGVEAFPLSRLAGPSIRARLLRTFLPLVATTVIGSAWLTQLAAAGVVATSAAVASAAMAVAAIALSGLICERIAALVGGRLERAEAELREARDHLEAKVDRRTLDLSRANEELARALQESRDAHESLKVAHLELQMTQSRMLQQARMASLGQTAAGVAHEINNPLAFVTNNLVVLRREVSWMHDILRLYQQAEETLARYQGELYTRICHLAEEMDLPFVLENLDSLLERSRAGLLRIQKVVADLRDFAHLGEAEYQVADLNAEIGTTVRLMQNLAERQGIALRTRLAPLPPSRCFPAKINMVVQNLVVNAIDASAPGDAIVIETRAADDAILITVADEGCGIRPEDRARVFDPFFTTKPVGKGTGLGLAISYAMVRDHGGTIDFDSEPGRGTRFVVRIPVVPDDPAPLPDGAGERMSPALPA
ncbi:Sensor protein ZraS [Aquisphaera giovannonii]|uniref:histidine kinase n=1 Tax=Aquisphaera giovannonii TaxID=406548 RepID=A0A5B9W719_9BACT|nr:ATP-binding protein [Aquisphaera giovannonii]QEH35811.1 Sensor protein ZraS [Aquisphaera giovannonii]